MTTRYNPFDLEKKWQTKWVEDKTFAVTADKSKPKYYVLEMLPYPSGKLHMGHVRNYTIGDVLARFKRAQGFNVMHPMGWDSFGLPAENAALKHKIHPAKWTFENIEQMKADMINFGWSYDWDREVASCHPGYYGKQQELFINFYENNMVYQKESLVNWDPVDHTVLANEQVVDGKGWRSGAPVERRSMHQWFMNITKYGDELLNDLQQLDKWPDRVQTMQENWIGRSEGLTFTFDVLDSNGDKLDKGMTVYTTRPDTIMGITFCSVAPEHPLAAQTASDDAGARSFIEECQGLGTAEEAIEKAEKKGYKTPYKAVHPITGEEVPIYIANFVLMAYGEGAVMAVPAHDERDYEFAVKYDLPIKQVVATPDGNMPEGEAYTDAGKLVNSGEFDGLEQDAAKKAVIAKIEDLGKGEKTINFRLRDWGISRQRYWGCPIPMVHCGDCGIVPVNKTDLPVQLPEDVSFEETGNPLERHPTWKHTTCPKCGGKAERETDTMDTFMDSSWYFLRYCSPRADQPLDDEANYWMNVDQYIGGIEHAVLHLLYARFFTKMLRDCGYVTYDEPFNALLCQGMVVAPSFQNADGSYIYPYEVDWKGEDAFHKETGEKLQVNRMEKVSKSKNNGEDPNTLLEKYGADTLRLFMMFQAPPERDLEWTSAGVDGSWRFMNRLWALVHNDDGFDVSAAGKAPAISELTDKDTQNAKRAIHKTIAKVSKDIDNFQFNTVVAAVMELSNTLNTLRSKMGDDALKQALYREGVEVALQLLNPVCPHVTEELWQELGHTTSIVDTPWPEADKTALIDDEITLVIQVNGKLKDRLTVPADISNEDAEKQALDAVSTAIADLTVRKCIVVPKRLVNIVAN